MKAWLNFINVLEDKRIIKNRPIHWKVRLSVSLILLTLSTAGIFITDFAPNFAWHYWCLMVPVFALLSIFLSWKVADDHYVEGSTIWHEILHWVGLLLAVFLVSVFVHNGIISYLMGALFILVLLALTMFLAGVYFDYMFGIIGILLGIMILAFVYFIKYLAVIVIPIVVIIGIVLLWRFLFKDKS